MLERENQLTGVGDLVEESMQVEAAALESIRDTEKALSRSRSLVDSYRPLSLYSALVFAESQRLCRQLNYHTLTLGSYQEMVADLLVKHRHGRPPDDPAACQKHVLRLQRNLLHELHHRLKWGMLHRHHLLLPLLVTAAELLANRQMSLPEWRALGEAPGLISDQIEDEQKPAWLSEEVRECNGCNIIV